MIFPYGIDFTYVRQHWGLWVTLVVCFAGVFVMGPLDTPFFVASESTGLMAETVGSVAKDLEAGLAIFPHGRIFLFLFSAFFLWTFGRYVEEKAKWLPFVLVFVTGHLAADVLTMVFGGSEDFPIMVNAGGVAAVVGCAMILAPKAKIETIVWLLRLRRFSMPLIMVVLIWLLWDYYSIPGPNDGPIFLAHSAALGVGALFGIFMRSKKAIPLGFFVERYVSVKEVQDAARADLFREIAEERRTQRAGGEALPMKKSLTERDL